MRNVAQGPSRHFAAAQQLVALGGLADFDRRVLWSRYDTPYE